MIWVNPLKTLMPSPALTDPSEQDYDDKAEDAVDFEDIDEEYDGPEVEATTEEDNVLSRKDYFSSNAAYALVNSTVSLLDEENYDEDDKTTNGVAQNCSSDVLTEQPVMEPSNVMGFEYEILQEPARKRKADHHRHPINKGEAG